MATGMGGDLLPYIRLAQPVAAFPGGGAKATVPPLQHYAEVTAAQKFSRAAATIARVTTAWGIPRGRRITIRRKAFAASTDTVSQKQVDTEWDRWQLH